MGSTGEPDRKRRHLSSISPTAAAAKKQPSLPISEEKKLDAAVLQYQNQKLAQRLEAQKVEYSVRENKFFRLKEKQQPYDSTLKVVNSSWEALVTDLESCSIRSRESICGKNDRHISILNAGTQSRPEDVFLSRLMEKGATESSSTTDNCLNHMEEDGKTAAKTPNNIMSNIVAAIDGLWYLKNGLYAAVLKELPEDGSCRQKASNELQSEVKKLRLSLSDLHLKHKSLSRELQSHQDMGAKNKADLKRIRGELESNIAELEESNSKLAALKAEKDATKGAFFPVLNIGSKHVAGDKVRDKQKDLQDMETALKGLLDEASSRLLELRGVHEERIKILQQLSNLQNLVSYG